MQFEESKNSGKIIFLVDQEVQAITQTQHDADCICKQADIEGEFTQAGTNTILLSDCGD